jgi:hypothetical protein
LLWQSRLMHHANLLGALTDILGEFRTLEFKRHLAFVKRELQARYPSQGGGIESLPEDALAHVQPVMGFFGAVGTLVANGVIDRVVVASYMGGSTLDAWSQLAPYIQNERKHRGDENYYKFFEHLAFIAHQYPPSRLKKELRLEGMPTSAGISGRLGHEP